MLMVDGPGGGSGGTYKPPTPAPIVPKAPPTPPPAPIPFVPTPTPMPAPKPPTPLIPTAPPVSPSIAGPPPTPYVPPVAPVSNSMTSPNGAQTTPLIGTPSGYPISQGVDSSATGLLPTGFTGSQLVDPNAPPDAATTPAQTYIDQANTQNSDATTWDVTPDQTVQGQYAGLMSQGNAAIQAAEEATTRKLAGSGGRNNIMAANAAAMSGSQVALQIATQDANTYAQAGQFNANAANDFKKAQNAFIDNALLSKQNFDQGVSMLKDQTNENIKNLYAQVEANAATQSTNLKATIGQIQAQTNATLETMDKTFAQNTATLGLQQQFANDNAWTNYGMQVRMGYLSSVGTQQTALMQTIADIRSNPNITTDQAGSAIKDAVDQFNSFMTMNNAYYSAMVPSGAAAYP